MTDQKKFKQRVRERMKRTGEPYATARRNLDHPEPSGSDSGGAGPNVDRLVAELRDVVARIWADMDERDQESNDERRRKIQVTLNANLERLGELGAAIHATLSAAGIEPRHMKGLIDGRRRSSPPGLPGTATFYAHLHSAESLLRFVDKPESANMDPKDTTIGAEFTMKIYARRHDSHESFRVVRTASGWSFTYFREVATGRDGRINRDPETGFFDLLDRESINYPADLPDYLEYLWDAAAEKGLSVVELEGELAKLATWISRCEADSPGGLFKGLK